MQKIFEEHYTLDRQFNYTINKSLCQGFAKTFLQDIVSFLSKLDNKAQHLQIFTCLFFGLIITQGGAIAAPILLASVTS